MGYLLTEIVVYLVIAGLIGFVFGWAVRDGILDKYLDRLFGLKIFKKSTETNKDTKSDATNDEKFCLITKVKKLWTAYYLTLTTTKKVVKEDSIPEKIAETTKKEVKTEEPTQEKVKEDPVKETVTEIAKEVEPEVTNDITTPILFTEAPTEGQDKLSSIKGIGPVLEKKLNELGVYSFEQIASWDAAQEVWIGTQMAFPKRVTKEEWVKQAKELLDAK